MKKSLATVSICFVIALTFFLTRKAESYSAAPAPPTVSAASVDPLLTSFFSSSAVGATVPAVITYDHMPAASEISQLRAEGINKGFVLRALPMVIVDMNLTQLQGVRSKPGVVSVWGNRVLKPYMNSSRRMIGAAQLMADREVTARNTRNPGMPISGKGIGVAYLDTGIDATNRDLELGRKVMQNVIQPLSHGVVSDPLFGLFYISISDMISDAAPGFVPPIYVENVPTSDLESGHGTHGAGVTAGTGANSGGVYAGVAPGAHLVGINSGYDLGLPLIAILAGYDYALINQFVHNLRIINNSWGSGFAESEIDPNNPINVATRRAHDLNMVVVFAAGNGGDTPDAINPYSTMPWTISAAAGEKQGYGTPAGFSSRGRDNGTGTDVAGMPADPNAPPNLRPDITAPGVAVIAPRARNIGPFMEANSVLNNDALKVPPAFQPFYLSANGTSFACPTTSGVVALMLEANPQLTPDDVVTILRQTANPMPYEERVVGAGFVDARNAVRRIFNLSAVAHPANLFPPPGLEIVDLGDDQIGTPAQDIISADYTYDATRREIVYTLTLASLANRTTNMQWIQSCNFGTTTLFVTAASEVLGTTTYEYGKIELLPTGTRQQTTIGTPDSGVINGNQIIIRLSIDKVNAAVGSNVLNTTGTTTEVIAQVLIGGAGTGLLFPSDTANGKDFEVR
jgi:serine protease AprX